MEIINYWLPEIWFVVIAFFLIYYALADGFTLGLGIISAGIRDSHERGVLMSSLEGVWQDNQTWLIVMGGMLFGAFPIFYGLVLSALYVPIFIMLFWADIQGHILSNFGCIPSANSCGKTVSQLAALSRHSPRVFQSAAF